jgi:hypothetical protein
VVDDLDAWLQDDDVVNGIATVALAVTALQNRNQGFSIPSVQDIVDCALNVSQHAWETASPQAVTRFCRPMMFPVIHDQHIVLALVQMDRDG